MNIENEANKLAKCYCSYNGLKIREKIYSDLMAENQWLQVEDTYPKNLQSLDWEKERCEDRNRR